MSSKKTVSWYAGMWLAVVRMHNTLPWNWFCMGYISAKLHIDEECVHTPGLSFHSSGDICTKNRPEKTNNSKGFFPSFRVYPSMAQVEKQISTNVQKEEDERKRRQSINDRHIKTNQSFNYGHRCENAVYL